jgi:hypothetical protein
MSLIQRLAIVYAALFLAVDAIGRAQAFSGVAGLAGPQSCDDLLYGFSGACALAAALASHRHAVLCFRLSGPVYLFDGAIGLAAGSGCLDGGIFIDGLRSFDDIEFPARLAANAPHLAIGGLAVLAGFWLPGRAAAGAATA